MDKRTAEVIATITEERRLFPEDRLFWFMWRRMRSLRNVWRPSMKDAECWADCRLWVSAFKNGWQTRDTEALVHRS